MPSKLKHSHLVKEYKVEFDGRSLTVPVGWPVSNTTAMGPDDTYRFLGDVEKFATLVTGLPDSMLHHDLKYRGLNVPSEYCAPYDSDGGTRLLKNSDLPYEKVVKERWEREGPMYHSGEVWAAYCVHVGRAGYWGRRTRGDGASHWYFHCELSGAEVKALRHAWATQDVAPLADKILSGFTGIVETEHSIYNFTSKGMGAATRKGPHGIKTVARDSGVFPVRQ